MTTKQITENGLNLIKKYESFYAEPYLCPAGFLTIGYGHMIRRNELFNAPISMDEALRLLKKDVEISERAVMHQISYPLNDNEFDALVSFTFNLGSGQLQRSTLRMKINRGELLNASKEFLKYVFAGGRKLHGLILRRHEELQLFLS
jgi:lysozyme